MKVLMMKCLKWFCLIFCSVVVSACNEPVKAISNASEDAVSSSLPQVQTNKADTVRAIQAPCVMQPQTVVKLKPELGGAIESVHVKLGEKVKQGQLLAVVRTIDLKSQAERLEIQQKQLEERTRLLNLQIEKIQREWDTLQTLYAKAPQQGPPIAKEAMLLLEKKSELASAQLTKRELDLQARQVQRLLKQAEIRSPMSGVVLLRNAEVGMVVASGGASFNGSDVLFEVGDPQYLKAECSARESDAEHLIKGQTLMMRFDGLPGADIVLHITEIAPTITTQGGMAILSFWAEFQVPAGHRVLPGMRGMAKLTRSQEKKSS
jgi:macrolide-specific efflux system membrane fusion protein